MRVLHVIATGQRRGAEVFASDLVRALPTTGDFEQEVVLLRGPWPPSVAYDAPVVPMRSGGRQVPGLRIDISTLSSLRAAMRRFRPQVVHAHGGEAFKYTALATVGHDTPIVYRRIGSAPGTISRGMRRVVHAALLRRSVRIIAVADAVRTETIDIFGISDDRVVTVAGGVDPDRIRAQRGRVHTRSSLGIPASSRVIVSIGALRREKDPLSLLDVCAAVVRSMPDIAYLFAGDGPMREEIRIAAASRGLAQHVRLLGVRKDIGDILHASDLLVHASVTEGMPGCVIEAGMAGLPVVAFGVAGVPEVVIDGVTGFVVKPGDRSGLEGRTVQLLADDRRRATMGRAAKAKCMVEFDIGSVARRYAEVFSQVAPAC